MVKSLRELHGIAIEATDGSIGSLQDIYFDDRSGQIRYFVVDTAKWLPGRRVLIAPEAIRHPWHDGTGLPVNLTRQQVRSSPDIATETPVSREAEMLLHMHYGWAPYWVGASLSPAAPELAALVEEAREAESASTRNRESHVQSGRDMIGFQICGADSKAGTLDDLLIDPEGGKVRFLVVKTGEWFSHKEVLLSPAVVAGVNWAESKITTTLSRHAIGSCPEYKSPGSERNI
jgi:sporulation protein YlmC with PRC-barrel domain